jgi:hypothetical protein
MSNFSKDGILHLSADEYADMLRHEFPDKEVKVVDGHVFVYIADEWFKMPFGYDGYNNPIKIWPGDE